MDKLQIKDFCFLEKDTTPQVYSDKNGAANYYYIILQCMKSKAS